ncbi:MAG: nucleotidyltransferase domain-containing protein [bacterium]
MISKAKINEAVERLVESADPLQIFLFGSYARGEAHKRSDLDFLVIKREVKNRRKEMVRLSDTLRSMRIPVDILVASEATFREWQDVVGTVFYEVKREGQLLWHKM